MEGLGRSPALGSRKSSAGVGRIPLQKDISRRSAASEAASSSGWAPTPPPSGKSPLWRALAAIGACFSPPETESEGRSGNSSGAFKTTHSGPSPPSGRN